MAECKSCEKPLNRESSEIGSWCIDCIKSMSSTNTGNMEAKRDSIKRERLIIIIFAGIGAVGGIFYGIAMRDMSGLIIGLIAGIWGWGGIGTGLGYFINSFASGFKIARADGKDFGEALKSASFGGIFYIVLGLFGGIIFFLILVLRRNGRIKKFNTIIASEDATIVELEGYSLGKDINKSELSRKISIIADNFDLAHDGVSLNDLKKLRVVQ